MKRETVAAAFWFLAVGASTPAQAQLERLQGIWRAVEISDEGMEVEKEAVKDVTLTIWRDRYILSLFDGTIAMDLKVDAAQQLMELTSRAGSAQPPSFSGRYQLTGDELLVAYSARGLSPPPNAQATGKDIRRIRWSRTPTVRQPPANEAMVNSLGMEMRLILPGTFVMGSPLHEPRRLDEAQRRTTISRPFYIGAHEVTVGQFRRFASERPNEVDKGGQTVLPDGLNRLNPTGSWDQPGFPQTDRHPVVFVSWEEANRFCQWLSEKEGKTYRLPTEAEWEYAARAGSQTSFWWGDDASGAASRANIGDQVFAERFPARDYRTGFRDGHALPAPVGSYAPNVFGLYDVAGNAVEWVQDWYGTRGSLPERDPVGPAAGEFKIGRGGGWANKPDEARSAFRFSADPTIRFSGSGLRVVLQVD